MGRFLILVDYKSRFLTSIENLNDYTSMDVGKIMTRLQEYGHSVEIVKYSELNLSREYKGCYCLYQSSEDIGGFYKDYIEDIVYFLQMKGAVLLPKFDFLLAHHNKNFMELLRDSFKDPRFKTIKSNIFGTGGEALSRIAQYPVVLKSAEGSGSYYVYLAKNKSELEKKVRKLSGVFLVNDLVSLIEFIIYSVCLKLFNKVQTRYRKYPFYRKKFLIQNFIEGLQGDYKVLYFGGKFYTMYRQNRERDFRASGSGKFILEINAYENQGLLEFARKLTEEIDFPIIGMDIGFDGTNYHLFEFQCVHIGPIALQASQYWHEYIDGKWVKYTGPSNLEEEFCRSINDYVQNLERQNVR